MIFWIGFDTKMGLTPRILLKQNYVTKVLVLIKLDCVYRLLLLTVGLKLSYIIQVMLTT